jgi:hypothetical protein
MAEMEVSEWEAMFGNSAESEHVASDKGWRRNYSVCSSPNGNPSVSNLEVILLTEDEKEAGVES